MNDKPQAKPEFGLVIYPRSSPFPIRVNAAGAAHANQLAGQLAEAVEHQKRIIDFPGAHGPQYICPVEVFAFWPTEFREIPTPTERLAAAQEKIASHIVPPREPWEGEEKK